MTRGDNEWEDRDAQRCTENFSGPSYRLAHRAYRTPTTLRLRWQWKLGCVYTGMVTTLHGAYGGFLLRDSVYGAVKVEARLHPSGNEGYTELKTPLETLLPHRSSRETIQTT